MDEMLELAIKRLLEIRKLHQEGVVWIGPHLNGVHWMLHDMMQLEREADNGI